MTEDLDDLMCPYSAAGRPVEPTPQPAHNDTALLRQALEALEGADQLLEDEGYAHAFQQEVITALKERLK